MLLGSILCDVLNRNEVERLSNILGYVLCPLLPRHHKTQVPMKHNVQTLMHSYELYLQSQQLYHQGLLDLLLHTSQPPAELPQI